MSLLFQIRQAIAKRRIKSLEHQAFLLAGKDISPQQAKAQKLRKKYGLRHWQYETNY